MANAKYVLLKRGYYFRPGAKGYTGLLSEAGRFSADEVIAYCDDPDVRVASVKFSPALSPSCSVETQRDYWRAKAEGLQARVLELEASNAGDCI